MTLKIFLLRWLGNSVALYLTAVILPQAVSFGSWHVCFVAALVLGLLNAIIRPVLLFLTLPLNIVTLGLFTIFVNAALFFSLRYIVAGFMVRGYGWAIVASILFSVFSTFFSWLLHERRQFNIGFHLWRY